jgi:hypothetical protein
MNIPDRTSESLESIFGVKIPKFFDAIRIRDPGICLTLDQGSGIEKIRSGIRDKHLGSATLVTAFP